MDKNLVDQACKKYKNTIKLARKEYTMIIQEDGNTDNDTCIHEHINISNDVLDMYFTEADVKKGIKNLKCNKSSDFDELTNEYLKSTEEILLPVWTLLFNHILDTGYILSNWQVGKIVPIFKKGDTK